MCMGLRPIYDRPRGLPSIVACCFLRKMASGIVRGAIGMVLEDKKLIQSKKNDEMRQFGAQFLRKITENETDMDRFDGFRTDIVAQLDTTFVSIPKTICLLSSKKSKCWSEFHKVRHTDLPKLWQDLLVTL